VKQRSNREAPRRREEAKALFRNAILAAAEQVFATRGFHAARIQDIAAAARIGVGTVYNHFADKEAVLVALMDERSAEFVARLAVTRDDPKDFVESLHARIGRLLEYVESHRGFFWILMGYGPGADLPGTVEASTRKMERFKVAFRKLVAEGVEAGALEDRDPSTLSAFLGGSLRAYTFGALLDGRPLKDKASEIVDLFLHGAHKRGRK
jgi:AcrR family transcriptional regulator